MSKHTFIVSLDVSDTSNQSVRQSLKDILDTWLENVNVLTKLPEKVVSISNVSKVENANESLLKFISIYKECIDQYILTHNLLKVEKDTLTSFINFIITKHQENGKSKDTGHNTPIMASDTTTSIE